MFSPRESIINAFLAERNNMRNAKIAMNLENKFKNHYEVIQAEKTNQYISFSHMARLSVAISDVNEISDVTLYVSEHTMLRASLSTSRISVEAFIALTDATLATARSNGRRTKKGYFSSEARNGRWEVRNFHKDSKRISTPLFAVGVFHSEKNQFDLVSAGISGSRKSSKHLDGLTSNQKIEAL